MTDLHDDATADRHEAQAEEPTWVPPDTLSPPPVAKSRPPVLALGAALGISLGAGVALWVSSQAFYVYILYNLLIGGALGWALSFGPKREGYANKAALLGAGVALSTLPYVLVKVLFTFQVIGDVQAQAPEVTFGQVFVFILENDMLFGIELGLIGSLVLLLAEVGITVYALHGRLVQGLAEARIASVPGDVIDFVVGGLASGWDTAQVREELANRGWKQSDDQDRAIGTGFDVISAMQAQAG